MEIGCLIHLVTASQAEKSRLQSILGARARQRVKICGPFGSIKLT